MIVGEAREELDFITMTAASPRGPGAGRFARLRRFG
jgi:hypothetical protein